MAPEGMAPARLFCLLPLILLVSCGASTSDSSVAEPLGEFFEGFLERELTRQELGQVTEEFIAVRVAYGLPRETIREQAKLFSGYAKVLKGEDGRAAALSMRHERITLTYFNPDWHGTVCLKLLTGPDPVRVIDLRSRRLMTERDVVALANLRRFAQSQGAPDHKALSRRQIEELVAALKATVGGNSGNMPQFFGETAAFWAGVQAAWPALNAEQRGLARAYAGRMWRIQMPVDLYAKLWGLAPKAASGRYADDVSARLSEITDINTQLGNLPLVIDAIFGQSR